MSICHSYTAVFLAVFFGFVLSNCEKKQTVHLGVYHWQTNYDLTTEETDFLKQQKADTVFTKYFDLVVNEKREVLPTAQVQFAEVPTQQQVPVVFITNDVFEVLDSSSINQLAIRVYDEITGLHQGKDFVEIQIDCDWNNTIKKKYFQFLEALKGQMGEKHLSCTIRLYQYKYPDLAGVPPVDSGTLMYYNMGNLRDYDEKNSILNNDEGFQYLGFGTYPLPLDLALPNFSWSLVFRFGQFKNISSEITDEWLSNEFYFMRDSNHYYHVLRDTVIGTTFLRVGDEVRREECSEETLLNAAEKLQRELNQSETMLLFYDLQPKLAYDSTKVTAVLHSFE